jgi:hypothetical protein
MNRTFKHNITPSITGGNKIVFVAASGFHHTHTHTTFRKFQSKDIPILPRQTLKMITTAPAFL